MDIRRLYCTGASGSSHVGGREADDYSCAGGWLDAVAEKTICICWGAPYSSSTVLDEVANCPLVYDDTPSCQRVPLAALRVCGRSAGGRLKTSGDGPPLRKSLRYLSFLFLQMGTGLGGRPARTAPRLLTAEVSRKPLRLQSTSYGSSNLDELHCPRRRTCRSRRIFLLLRGLRKDFCGALPGARPPRRRIDGALTPAGGVRQV